VNDTLLRLGFATAIIVLGAAAYVGWNRLQLRRLRGGAAGSLLGLESRPPNTPAVLYFRTPDCLVCATAQRPALDRLVAHLGNAVSVIEIDATLQPAVADYWGVLSAPTTFVIDAAGQPRAINHGLASKEKLLRQLEAASAAPAEAPLAAAEAALAPEPLETDWSVRHESYPRTH